MKEKETCEKKTFFRLFFFLFIKTENEQEYSMADSPVPTPRESQTEILTKSLEPDIRTSTPIMNASISEKVDLPNLLKEDEILNSLASHVDENNENEAVRLCID